jgi:shikimate 5-dehydrogenase
MKKNITILAGGIAFALAFQSCQQKADMSVFNAKIDSIANVKVDEYKAQLMQECSDKVRAAAIMKADSLIAAATKGGKKPAPKPTPTPAPKPEEKKDGGKIIDKTNDGKVIDKMNQQQQGGGKLIDKMGGKK